MTVVFEQVDTLYDDVIRRGHVCQECVRSRPSVKGQRYKKRKVIMFQLTPEGQFHMRLPETTAHSLCGRDVT